MLEQLFNRWQNGESEACLEICEALRKEFYGTMRHVFITHIPEEEKDMTIKDIFAGTVRLLDLAISGGQCAEDIKYKYGDGCTEAKSYYMNLAWISHLTAWKGEDALKKAFHFCFFDLCRQHEIWKNDANRLGIR